jgi:hypothetical protein
VTDPCRVFDTPQPRRTPRPVARGGSIRPVLWLLLVICAAANAVTSTAGLTMMISIGFGVATLACAAALVVHHYRHRASR